ncbi:YciI family protein [Xenorhabdus sp. PB30.3]|uniref:YciI family protein n=1 Tax=Xenorhabdus sp. PB30.3 TaxID=2788941 RepID=UPI001E2ECEF0|nr:YciI family protein [Xenorhabdus sp. PB30.3]MCC8380042.1 GTP cyclohydrolase [Xenorhabdus sp. PB30.3]
MFVVTLTYIKPLTEVEHFLEEHRIFLDTCYLKRHFLASGPKEPRNGGVILVNSMSRKELDTLLESDPFYRENIAEYSIIEFHPVKFDACLSDFIRS